MSLSQSTLKSNILQALKDNLKDTTKFSPAVMSTICAKNLASAYDKYAQNVSPPGLKIVTPGLLTGLQTSLVAPLMAGWGPGLIAYWTPATFAGPGFIPVNPTVTAGLSPLAAAVALLMPIQPKSIDDFADSLSKLLHTYTVAVLVTTTTTSAPPVVATVPLA